MLVHVSHSDSCCFADMIEDKCRMFIGESRTMTDFTHENVLQLIGVSLKDNGEVLVITPYMEKGNLLAYIREETNVLTMLQLLNFGLDVAKGMEYLCNQRIVHRDLAARNCLLDDNLVVKVADFGLSRDVYQSDYYVPEKAMCDLPFKWMAPECIKRQKQSYKSDVWSFGVLLWEVTTR